MSKRTAAYILTMVAVALGAPTTVDTIIDSTAPETVAISGPDASAVGELVKLSINGTSPTWLMPTDDFHTVGNDVYVSFRTIGSFEVVGASLQRGVITTLRHIIVVGTTEPEPEPVAAKLTQLVIGWCESSNAPKLSCQELGANFLSTAKSATNLDLLLQDIATKNRKVNQKGTEQVLTRVQQYLFENLRGESFESHRAAFIEIGTALTNYSQS